MKTYLLTLLYFAAGSLVNAEDNNTNKNEDMNKPTAFPLSKTRSKCRH